MLMSKAEIGARLPHAGAMCLLDGVLSWDATRISCTAGTHRSPDNPLRRDGRLHTICGIEYAAQAMALHAALASGGRLPPRAGYLASVRDIHCRVACLDAVEGDLLVEAEQLTGEESRAIYRFALLSAQRELLTGRAAVLLKP
jgi:predicted hotdog family 3-hydroxylacyl-ACP dehydratase